MLLLLVTQTAPIRIRKKVVTIALVDSLEDLNTIVEELGEHIEVESMGVGEEYDDEDEECIYKGAKELQKSYNYFLEKTREYARVAKAAIRKMKKAKQDYKSILVRYKEINVKLSVLLQRNLMRCLHIKSPLLIEVAWDTPKKVAQALMCLRR